jgi:hypothetical protein
VKTCICGKEVHAKKRCIFHQPPQAKNRGKLLVAWFPTDGHKFERIVLDRVVPLIKTLKPKRWYFINHFGIVDVGIFEERGRIRRALSARKMAFIDMEPLPPKEYGGAAGVELCYDALQAFSELRIKSFRAGMDLGSDRQLIHYFFNQIGLDNLQEAIVYLISATRFLTRNENFSATAARCSEFLVKSQ